MKYLITIALLILITGCCTPKRWTDNKPLEVTPTTDNMTIDDSIEIDIK